MQTIELLNLASLDRNPERQMRVAKDESCVEDYAERMLAGDEFPPIIVYRGDGVDRLVDGYQRAEAAERAGIESLPSIIKVGDARAATLAALAANKAHGLRRSNSDKRKAVLTMLRDPEWQQWSNNEIAAHCGVSHTMVGGLRNDLEGKGEIEPSATRRVERNGQVYDMDVSGFSAGQDDGHAETEHNSERGARGKAVSADDLPSSLGGEVYDPDDDGYDGPLGVDETDDRDAGYRPLPDAPEVSESWLNKAGNPIQATLQITGVRMASGAIRLGDEEMLSRWPETLNVLGLALSLIATDEDEEGATSHARYGTR